jgi:glycosyltransferase involved in cell wall biosynthesis
MDPMKGHSTLLRAIRQVIRGQPNVQFVCVGGGSRRYLARLRALARDLEVQAHIQWVAPRHDIENAYRRFDFLCLPSYCEGFPNVVGEAMSCGTPCVVTNAGDSSHIVGDTGWVVEAGDHEALAGALLQALRLPEDRRLALGDRARQRIEAHFSVERMVETTAEALAGE